MSENIQNRVSSIFEKLNNISTSVQDEKNNRFHAISQLIMAFEAQLQHQSDQKEEKFVYKAAKVRQITEFLEQEQRKTETFKLITDLERHVRRLIEQNSKERVEQEKKIIYSIGQQIESLQQDVIKERIAQSTSHEYIDSFLNEELPKIADELQNEITERKDVEEKIYHQFVEQLNDLRLLFEKEKKEREIKEEEIIENLREISNRIQDQLRKTRGERERTKETLVTLVEKVIEKLKREMLEMNL
ncbi:unnamed protein product [Paramecium octaurelia]|uniref:Uncharacterized protein n=1 Tax=Paramecium octaurelia TaxID=43137 RepID=A0A8S1TMJ4_PAROT|nr:unnamed protein product [Paramecium octaurelia]